ncbi:MAG: tRNA pseudouridine(55) synthase TruB [Magnetospirillum sp. WYHS-4]
MGRKRRGRAINGWLVVDKPVGVTSNDVVVKARRLFDAAKVGHGGTLDPLATGLLPLAFGEATKTVSFVMDGAKTYRFTVRWGEARDTEDAEGKVTATSDVRPTREAIEAILPTFVGEIEQVPPAFSAIKVDGKRAYDLARADQPVELEPRIVRIDRLALIAQHDTDHAEFEVHSGKGAYMRSLARDLALALGTVGYVAALRRIKVGPFAEGVAISLDKLLELGHIAPPLDLLLPVETALADIPALALTEAEARRLHHGQPLPALPVLARLSGRKVVQGDILRAMSGDRLVAIASIKGGEIRPLRVLNLEIME